MAPGSIPVISNYFFKSLTVKVYLFNEKIYFVEDLIFVNRFIIDVLMFSSMCH